MLRRIVPPGLRDPMSKSGIFIAEKCTYRTQRMIVKLFHFMPPGKCWLSFVCSLVAQIPGHIKDGGPDPWTALIRGLALMYTNQLNTGISSHAAGQPRTHRTPFPPSVVRKCMERWG